MLPISPNGEVVSQTFGLSKALPTWRFVLHPAGVATSGTLNVWVQWTDASGNTGQVPVTALSSSVFGSWAPSLVLIDGSVLPDNTTVNAQLVFSADSAGSWRVDDVYIDPYAR